MGPESFLCAEPPINLDSQLVRFVNWPVFEWTIILTIIANCVVMSLDDKLPVGDKTILSIKMVRTCSSTFLPNLGLLSPRPQAAQLGLQFLL